MKTLNRDAVPSGDDIESVEKSRVDVETGNEEEQEPEVCGHAVTGVGVLFVSKVAVLGNIFKLNRWRKKKENEEPQWWLLIAFS